MGEMRIMAYNRVIKKLPVPETAFLQALEDHFTVRHGVSPVPASPGRVSVLLGETWYGVDLPASERNGVAASLDSARLGEHILGPLLGITDLRTDPNIAFVGGIRGTGALEDAVRNGSAAAAFSLYPTSISELVDVSDAGELMPPKSTWFEPKLRSGLLVHTFEA
jgi:uncharacterized protein (DUF1015 family)